MKEGRYDDELEWPLDRFHAGDMEVLPRSQHNGSGQQPLHTEIERGCIFCRGDRVFAKYDNSTAIIPEELPSFSDLYVDIYFRLSLNRQTQGYRLTSGRNSFMNIIDHDSYTVIQYESLVIPIS